MKKWMIMWITVFLCLCMPVGILASESEIRTTVPETHTVAIEAVHASALYVGSDKGLSSAYPVPRFSKPKFKLTAEDGYEIERVLLNGKDVTKKVKKGTLKLSKVCENQVIKIETKTVGQEEPVSSQAPKPSQTPQASQAAKKRQNTEKTGQKQETGKQLPSASGEETGREDTESGQKEPDHIQEAGSEAQQSEETGHIISGDSTGNTETETVSHSSFWWILLLLLCAVILLILFLLLLKKKKERKNEEKTLDSQVKCKDT